MRFSRYRILLLAVAALILSSAAHADAPDLEGRVSDVDYSGHMLVVRNELTNQLGNRDYRVGVKQGMINDYKKNDRLRIWLDVNDSHKAEMIERISR